MLFQQFLSLLSCIQLLFPFFYFPNFFLQIKTKIKKQTAKDRAKHSSPEASSLSFSWHYIFVPPCNKGHCLSRWLGQILSATNHILLSWQRKLWPGNEERVTPEPLPVALGGVNLPLHLALNRWAPGDFKDIPGTDATQMQNLWVFLHFLLSD